MFSYKEREARAEQSRGLDKGVLKHKLSYVICDGSWNWMPARSSSMVSIQSKPFDIYIWCFHSSNSSSKITPKTK